MNHKCGTDKQGDAKANIVKEKGNRGGEGEHKGGCKWKWRCFKKKGLNLS